MRLEELTILEARVREGMNAEYTLDAKALLQPLVLGLELEVGDEIFRVFEMSMEGCGRSVMNLRAEHISYDLHVPMPSLPDIIETDEGAGEQTVKPNPHVMEGEYTPYGAVAFILRGTAFAAGEVMSAPAKEFRLSKMSRREALFKVAEFFDAELIFSKHTVGLARKRGQDRGKILQYGVNLKSLEKGVGRDGTGYLAEAVESLEAEFALGDTVRIEDGTMGISEKVRILALEYDPLRRIVVSMELGERAETFADLYERDVADVDRKIEEALKDLPGGQAPSEKIVEVTKETVLSAEVIHATTAWIEELEVNYLRTNFRARMENAGGEWNYIYAHGMEIEFNTARLHATEKEPYQTASGRKLYWTAIGQHEDAKRYFTLQPPQIKEGAKIIVDGVERDLVESDFFVMVPRIVEQATKLRISFEQVPGKENIFPVMTWGQGDGTANGQKCYLFKDERGLVVRYHKNEDEVSEIAMTDRGIRVKNPSQPLPERARLHNVVVTYGRDTPILEEGDIWFSCGLKSPFS